MRRNYRLSAGDVAMRLSLRRERRLVALRLGWIMMCQVYFAHSFTPVKSTVSGMKELLKNLAEEKKDQ